MQRLLRCCVWLFLTACATSSSLPTRRSATETIAIDTCEGTVLAFDIFADDSALIMVLSGYGRFYRAVPLPEGVDANACNAQFKDGVLEVTVKMPKQTQQKRQRIDIK